MNTANTIQLEPQETPTRERAQPGRPRRIGLLGAGYIAEWHAKAIRSVNTLELAAVCDKSLSRATQCAQTFGIPHVFGELDEMLESGKVDAVHVLLPPDIHFSAAKKVIEAGLDVFLEKPMCTSAKECRTLVECAKERGVRLGVGHNFLFGHAYESLRRDVRSGVLGKLDHVSIDWNHELGYLRGGPFDVWMLRDPKNIMLEIGPHSVAHLLDLIGPADELDVRVGNRIELPTGVGFYQRWQASAVAGGSSVDLRFSFFPGFGEHTIQVRGALGSAVVDFGRNTYILRRHTANDDAIDRYVMGRAEARNLARQARRNLIHYALSKFKLSKRGNAYGVGITEAIRAFYSPGELADTRVSGAFGVDVIEMCERIAQRAGITAVPSHEHGRIQSDSQPLAPKILVLGASGFIGLELLRQLVKAGRPVRILVRNASKLPPELRGPGVQIVRGDLSNPADIDNALEGVEQVYHLARAFAKTWAQYQSQEIEMTRRIAERCLAKGIKRLLYTGSIDSFYAGTADEIITEQTPLDPRITRRNLYARAKAESEELLLRMQREQRLPLVIARPGIVIGRGGSPLHWGVGMWRHGSVVQTWGHGHNKLPIVLVEDVAAGLILAMDAPGIEGESFNLVGEPCLSAREYLDELDKAGRCQFQRFEGSPRGFFAGEVFKWIVKLMVRHPERRIPSYRDWASRTQQARFDCSKARSRLNWQPTSNRDEVIQRGIQIPVREFLG